MRIFRSVSTSQRSLRPIQGSDFNMNISKPKYTTSYTFKGRRFYTSNSNNERYPRVMLKNKNVKVFDSVDFDFNLLEQIPLFSSAKRDEFFFKRFGGMSNTNYGIIFKDKKYVLRLPNIATDPSVSREDEIINLEEAAKLGLTLNPIYFNTSNGLVLKPYIEGQELYPGNMDSQDLSDAAATLAKLHTSNAKLPKTLNNFERLRIYHDLIISSGTKFDKKYIELWHEISRIEKLMSCFKAVRPSHNDPHPVNFIKTPFKRVFLLDWEYATMSDPIWDISYFITFGSLNKQAEAQFLTNYTTYCNSIDHLSERVLAYRPVIEFSVAVRLKLQLAKKMYHYSPDEIEDWEKSSLVNTQNALSCPDIQNAINQLEELTIENYAISSEYKM